jgi:hypothetical protein
MNNLIDNICIHPSLHLYKSKYVDYRVHLNLVFRMLIHAKLFVQIFCLVFYDLSIYVNLSELINSGINLFINIKYNKFFNIKLIRSLTSNIIPNQIPN